MAYKIPANIRIGHVHLKVSDLERSLEFYLEILGFDITMRFGDSAAFLAAGLYHHHIALNTWYSQNHPKASKTGTGLFHVAILYPTRRDLAVAVKRILDAAYPITGVADHGVSQAIYLDDPDGNGIELYWDRPLVEWPINKDGNINMYTRSLDMDDLLQLAD